MTIQAGSKVRVVVDVYGFVAEQGGGELVGTVANVGHSWGGEQLYRVTFPGIENPDVEAFHGLLTEEDCAGWNHTAREVEEVEA